MDYWRLPVGIGLLSLMLFTGCVSTTYVPKRKIFKASTADFTVTMAYLSHNELVNLHGKNTYGAQNPFVDYPGRFPPK